MAATDSRGENVRVAVLGTGIMGAAITRTWSRRGCTPPSGTGRRTATTPLADAGATVAASAAGGGPDAHVVITMLPTAGVAVR